MTTPETKAAYLHRSTSHAGKSRWLQMTLEQRQAQIAKLNQARLKKLALKRAQKQSPS